jgi:2-oxoglutarate ferredoxin oxidoreductase subunit beta
MMVGASFVGRSFSGDKGQMVPLIMAAMRHPGPAFIDIISPCVAFNNHAGSTKAYDFVRAHNEAVNNLDIMEPRDPITVEYAPGTTEEVALHDGSSLRLAKLDANYDPHDRIMAMAYLQAKAAKGELVTGLIYMDDHPTDMHANLNTVDAPLNSLGEKDLNPGAKALDGFNASHR